MKIHWPHLNSYPKLLIIFGAILAAVFTHQASQAQPSQLTWSYPVLVHEQIQGIDQPVLIGDRSGQLHLFWSDIPRGGEDTLYYMRYDGDTWTSPVDLFTGSNISSQSAVVDDAGTLHLVWNDGIQLFYSQVPVNEALSAGSWATPLSFGDSLPHAQVVVGQNNRVFIILPSLGAGGPSLIRSDDGGATWFDNTSIALTASADTAADFTRLTIGPDGSMHAVWTEYQLPNGFPPTGIYYAKSSDGGINWTKPLTLAGDGFVQANIIVNKSNEVHIIWSGMAGIGGRYHQWSVDGGSTWSAPTAFLPAPTGGTEGVPQLVLDSADSLHVLASYGLCPTYSNWQNRQWANTACIAQGASQSGYSEEPTLALTEGNRLHAVFWDDRKRFYYTSMVTNAPQLPLQPFPTPTPFETPTSAVSSAGMVASTPAPFLPDALKEETQPPSLNPIWPVATSISLVLLIIIGAIGLRFIRNKIS